MIIVVWPVPKTSTTSFSDNSSTALCFYSININNGSEDIHLFIKLADVVNAVTVVVAAELVVGEGEEGGERGRGNE